MFDEVPPFELLKLIRDGVVTHKRDLSGIIKLIGYTRFGYFIDQMLDDMQELGWIEILNDGLIKTTKRITEVQKALGLSLTQLSPYGNNSVVANPLFGRPKGPPKPADLFVMMPFIEDLRAVYYDHILGVTKRLGISATRADDFFAANSIIADVWNAINRAQVLIADCTGRNPNVFYELGVAHTLGKPVILIAQNKSDIPFDVQHIRTIIYQFTPRGMRDFENALETTLQHEIREARTLADLLKLSKKTTSDE